MRVISVLGSSCYVFFAGLTLSGKKGLLIVAILAQDAPFDSKQVVVLRQQFLQFTTRCCSSLALPYCWKNYYDQRGEIRGPFLESSDNFPGPESYFMSARFSLKIPIFVVVVVFFFKAKQ